MCKSTWRAPIDLSFTNYFFLKSYKKREKIKKEYVCDASDTDE